ncbi:hypothetical protein DY000_02055766 [Brassica cretica]|uniref:Uncharacterized protein n=1 Tax=Brassica cretica TaxID=69181 RepID=A0ABQ7A5K1_BRACR|nr:hypothetical protein DY000_02055766 [Brassica cretica]
MANPQKAGQHKETVLTRFLLFCVERMVDINTHIRCSILIIGSLFQFGNLFYIFEGRGSQSLDWPARLSCLRSISTLIFGKKASFMISWRLSCCQRVLDQNDNENGGSSVKAHISWNI